MKVDELISRIVLGVSQNGEFQNNSKLLHYVIAEIDALSHKVNDLGYLPSGSSDDKVSSQEYELILDKLNEILGDKSAKAPVYNTSPEVSTTPDTSGAPDTVSDTVSDNVSDSSSATVSDMADDSIFASADKAYANLSSKSNGNVSLRDIYAELRHLREAQSNSVNKSVTDIKDVTDLQDESDIAEEEEKDRDLNEVISGPKSPVGAAIKAAKLLGQSITSKISDFGDSISSKISKLSSGIKRGASWIIDNLPIVVSILYLLFGTKLPEILKDNFMKMVKPLLDRALENPTIKKIWDKLQSLFSYVKDDLYNDLMSAIASIKSAVSFFGDDSDRYKKGREDIKAVLGGDAYVVTDTNDGMGHSISTKTKMSDVDGFTNTNANRVLSSIVADYFGSNGEDPLTMEELKKKYKDKIKGKDAWGNIESMLHADYSINNNLSHSFINDIKEKYNYMGEKAVNKIISAYGLASILNNSNFTDRDFKGAKALHRISGGAATFYRGIAGMDSKVAVIDSSNNESSLSLDSLIKEASKGILNNSKYFTTEIDSSGNQRKVFSRSNISSDEVIEALKNALNEKRLKLVTEDDTDLKLLVQQLRGAISDVYESTNQRKNVSISNNYIYQNAITNSY